jgi:hypothetical protein
VKKGTITIVKDAQPNDAQDFAFSGTLGAFTLDDDAGVQDPPGIDQPQSKSFGNLPANIGYTVIETEPNIYWALKGITCVNTADGTPYTNVTPSGMNVIVMLDPGADVTCTFVNAKSPTRTQGFWQTHTSFTSGVFAANFSGGMPIGSGSHRGLITDSQLAGQSQLFGAYYSNIAKISTAKGNSGQRSAIDKARMQLLQQLVTAKLNCAAFGCASGVNTMIATADAAYAAGTSVSAILSSAGALDAYNNSGDTIIFSPPLPAPGNATPSLSKFYANLTFWNTP